MAQFVVRFHMRPTDYNNLTLLEREEIVKEFNRQSK